MSGTSSTTQSSTSAPSFAPQLGALTSAFGNAQNVYNQDSQAVAPTNFTAQMTPDQLATFQQMVQQGGNQSVAQGTAATSGALQTAGTSGVTGALTGLNGYNAADTNNSSAITDAANKYVAGQNIPAQVKAAMQGATETARDVTMPGIEQNAAIGGNTNSSRTGIADGLVQRGLAEQSANLNGSLSGTAYANGLSLAEKQAEANNTSKLGALSTEGNIGNTAAASGVNAGATSIADQGALDSTALAGGTGQQAAAQADLTNQLQQYQSKENAGSVPLQNLMSIIGSQNWGSTTNGTTSSTPSAWSTISGLLSGAGAGVGGAAKLMAL